MARAVFLALSHPELDFLTGEGCRLGSSGGKLNLSMVDLRGPRLTALFLRVCSRQLRWIFVETALDEFIVYLRAERGLSPKTIDAYGNDLRIYIDGLLCAGVRAWEGVRREHV